jgi:hypothetical protein
LRPRVCVPAAAAQGARDRKLGHVRAERGLHGSLLQTGNVQTYWVWLGICSGYLGFEKLGWCGCLWSEGGEAAYDVRNWLGCVLSHEFTEERKN